MAVSDTKISRTKTEVNVDDQSMRISVYKTTKKNKALI